MRSLRPIRSFKICRLLRWRRFLWAFQHVFRNLPVRIMICPAKSSPASDDSLRNGVRILGTYLVECTKLAYYRVRFRVLRDFGFRLYGFKVCLQGWKNDLAQRRGGAESDGLEE